MTLADRIVVISKGRIEQEGAPEEVYERPTTRFVADFIGAANLIPGSVRDGCFTSAHGLTLPLPPGRFRGKAEEVVFQTPREDRYFGGANCPIPGRHGGPRDKAWRRTEILDAAAFGGGDRSNNRTDRASTGSRGAIRSA